MRAITQPRKSDSVISSAEMLADIMHIPWLRVRRFYMALQQGNEPLIPKSKGKQIYGAQPEYAARLLIALAGTMIPSDAPDVVRMIAAAATEGRAQETFEEALCALLRDRKAASKVTGVEITPQLGRAEIEFKGGKRLRFGALTKEWLVIADAGDDFLPAMAAVQFTGSITGAALRLLAEECKWSEQKFLATGAAS